MTEGQLDVIGFLAIACVVCVIGSQSDPDAWARVGGRVCAVACVVTIALMVLGVIA